MSDGATDGDPSDMEELPQLPQGWCWAELGELAQIDGGITKDQNRRRKSDLREVPYLRVANVQRGFIDLDEVKTISADEETIQSLALRPGDILFTEGGDRDKLGRGWVWNGELSECIHQNHIFRARPDQTVVSPKFVSHHGNLFGRDWFLRHGKQTTNLASINKSVLRRFPVLVPPRAEQDRILARLDELLSDLDAGVAALERARANLKKYRAAVLKAAVSGELTADWRAAHPDVEPASQLLDRILTERRQKWEADQQAKFTASGKTSSKGKSEAAADSGAVKTPDLTILPVGWCWATIEQALDIIDYRGRTPPYSDAGVPHLRSLNVKQGKVIWDGLTYVTEESYQEYMTRGLPEPGDLLFTTEAPLGEVAIAPTESRFSMAQRLMLLRPVSGLLVTKYLMYQLMAPDFQSLLRFSQTGSTVTGVSSRNFKPLPIRIPPLAEQEVIASEVEQQLSVISASEAYITTSLKRAGRLRQSILKEAFAGQLVPQDPTDEPASVLLDRIRQARTTTNGTATVTRSRRSRKTAPPSAEAADGRS